MKFKSHVFHSIDVSPGYVNCLDCKSIRKAIGIHAVSRQMILVESLKES